MGKERGGIVQRQPETSTGLQNPMEKYLPDP
jgi:hypothetical protein